MLAQTRKAWVAGIITFLGPFVVLLGTANPIDVRAAVLAFFTGTIAGLTTYIVPNALKRDPDG